MKFKKLIQLYFIKIKNLCSLKETGNQPPLGRKYFQITYMIKDLYPQYKMNFQNSILRETIQFQKWEKVKIDTSLQKIHR